MKILKKKFIARMLAATLVAAGAIVSIELLTGSSQAIAAACKAPDGTGGVWNTQVVTYLNSYSYTNVQVLAIDATGNRTCASPNCRPGYNVVVYVSGGSITGHAEIPATA